MSNLRSVQHICTKQFDFNMVSAPTLSLTHLPLANSGTRVDVKMICTASEDTMRWKD